MPLCFVLMPFGSDALNVFYEFFLRPVVERCNLRCLRADAELGSTLIVVDIVKRIREAALIIADLTTQNGNVLYEVGLADALGKPVLLLTQTREDVPFDLQGRRIFLYHFSTEGCLKLRRKLPDHIVATLSRHRKRAKKF